MMMTTLTALGTAVGAVAWGVGISFGAGTNMVARLTRQALLLTRAADAEMVTAYRAPVAWLWSARGQTYTSSRRLEQVSTP